MQTVNYSRTGSETIGPVTINDRINLKAHLIKKGFTWRDLSNVFAYRGKYSVSYSIKGKISGDLSLS